MSELYIVNNRFIVYVVAIHTNTSFNMQTILLPNTLLHPFKSAFRYSELS